MKRLTLLAALVLAAGVAAVVITISRRVRPFGRRPHPRHIVVRIVCGALGLLVLGAVGISTWLDCRRWYAAEAAAPTLQIRVPADEPPPLPVKPGGSGVVHLRQGRLLLHVVAADVARGTLRPVQAAFHEVLWEQGKLPRVEGEFEAGEATVSYTLTISGTASVADRPEVSPRLEIHGTHIIRSQIAGAVFHADSGVLDGDAEVLGALERRHYGPSKQPLSIVLSPEPDVRLLAFFALAAPDDPLADAPLAPFLERREPDVVGALGSDTRHDVLLDRRRLYGYHVPARGFGLAGHIGLSSLLVLAAVVLLAQVFRRRSLAFAGLLAAAIVYVAILDRAVLGHHLAHLNDPAAPTPARLVACAQATDTYFFRRTALDKLRWVGRDRKAPPRLRSLAAEGAAMLSLYR